MKVTLSRNFIAPDNGVPIIKQNKESGIEIPDPMIIQYEQLKTNFIQMRDILIEAYKKAGGDY